MARLTPLARNLRVNATEAEKKLWRHLRANQFHGLSFRRQVPIDRYIADFLCYEQRLIIELDGGQHCDSADDIERTRILESKGFLLIRFWNNNVLTNIKGVLQTIESHLPFLPPPPEGEGRGGGAQAVGLKSQHRTPSPNPSLRERGKKEEATL